MAIRRRLRFLGRLARLVFATLEDLETEAQEENWRSREHALRGL
jgi:hypothetical protein